MPGEDSSLIEGSADGTGVARQNPTVSFRVRQCHEVTGHQLSYSTFARMSPARMAYACALRYATKSIPKCLIGAVRSSRDHDWLPFCNEIGETWIAAGDHFQSSWSQRVLFWNFPFDIKDQFSKVYIHENVAQSRLLINFFFFFFFLKCRRL
jgi:hypothetical protein